MIINITIPNTKASTRFPGKNALLADHTVTWLNEELKDLKDHKVTVLEVISPDTPQCVTPYGKLTVDSGLTHEQVCMEVEERTYADVYVHLQLTQPKRRKGLLNDAINALVTSDKEVISSYAEWYDDYTWRLITNDTFRKELHTGDRMRKYYDGSIYVAHSLYNIFREPTVTKWGFIKNLKGPLVDVDYPEQWNEIRA